MHNIVSVPFSFEFRKRLVQWHYTRARIVGWAREADGSAEGRELMAEIGGKPVRYLRENLPEQWANLWMRAYSDKDVARVLASFRPIVLFSSAILDNSQSGTQDQFADAWSMRDEFLRVQPDGLSFLVFLNRWGMWSHAEFVQPSELISLQVAIREALLSSAEAWLQSDHMSLPVWQRRSEHPYFGVLTNLAEVAIRMTVTIDVLNQVKFKQCARADCGQPFVESRQDRKFCSRECTHTESVRRSRKKQVAVLKD